MIFSKQEPELKSVCFVKRDSCFIYTTEGHMKNVQHVNSRQNKTTRRKCGHTGGPCCPNFRHPTLCFAILLKFLRMASLNTIRQLRRNLKYFQLAGYGVASRLSEPRGCLRAQGRVYQKVQISKWRSPKMRYSTKLSHSKRNCDFSSYFF